MEHTSLEAAGCQDDLNRIPVGHFHFRRNRAVFRYHFHLAGDHFRHAEKGHWAAAAVEASVAAVVHRVHSNLGRREHHTRGRLAEIHPGEGSRKSWGQHHLHFRWVTAAAD